MEEISSVRTPPSAVSPATVGDQGTPTYIKEDDEESETPEIENSETWKGEPWTPNHVSGHLRYQYSQASWRLKHSCFGISSRSQDKKLKALVSSKKKGSKKKDSDPNAEVQADFDWEKIATSLGAEGRSAGQCKKRFNFLTACQIGKGPWSAIEDQQIVKMVSMYGKLTPFTIELRKSDAS
jgi:hypothetical protein